ncbi:MAG: hypothetical protein E6J90_33305 [Deltaproteobacteria bacterium]|nr:MAG: hypothetical protein E6J90_33305 [Deltaproteobacteria bacterium]
MDVAGDLQRGELEAGVLGEPAPDARGPVDTPPVRSGKPCRKPSLGSTGERWSRIAMAGLLPW